MKNFNIKIERKNGVVIFVLEGRMDSNNSIDFSNILMSNIQRDKDKSVTFDCKKLDYISSAGLRVLLSLRKKEKLNVKLINVSDEVNNILDTTGFSQIFEVSKAIEDISGTLVKLMGETSDLAMYKMPDDTILKLYPAGTQLEDVEKELRYTKATLVSGVPTLISYYIVIYNGRYGIIYEMPNVKTVSAMIDFQKWKLGHYSEEMGKTLRLIHECEPDTTILPQTSKIFLKYALKMQNYFNDEEAEKLLELVKAIPEKSATIYGNYHSGNVFVQNDELILINMAGVSYGNPIFDLGRTYMTYVLEAEWLSKRLTGLEANLAKKFWDIMIRSYLDTNDEEIVKEHEEVIKSAALLCSALFPAMGNLSESDTEKLIAKTRRNVFPMFDKMKDLLSKRFIEQGIENLPF